MLIIIVDTLFIAFILATEKPSERLIGPTH